MADLSTYSPIYIRTSGDDTTGDGSLAAPFATAQKGFETAYLGTGNKVLDLGEGTFGGVNLNVAFVPTQVVIGYDENGGDIMGAGDPAKPTEWPSRIAVRGVSVSLSNLGGIEIGDDGEDAGNARHSINITGNSSVNLGLIRPRSRGPYVVGGETYEDYVGTGGTVTLTDIHAGDILLRGIGETGAGGSVTLNNCIVGNINVDCAYHGPAGSVTVNNSTTGHIYADGGQAGNGGAVYLIGNYSVLGVSLQRGWDQGTWMGAREPGFLYINGVLAQGSYFGTGYSAGRPITGTGWYAPIYYIGGVQTTLPQSGTGAWNNKYWIGGTETTLSQSGTGWWIDTYYIGGVATTLPDSGTGFWNDNSEGGWTRCYVNGQVNDEAIDCYSDCGGGAVLDCSGTCNGGAVVDDCGVCGGNNAKDCAGVCGGSAVVDDCGVCGGNNGSVDCNGGCGDHAIDSCGNCTVYWETTAIDECGVCSGMCYITNVLPIPYTGWFSGGCDCFPEGFYIQTVLTPLPQSGTGWWNNKFWIGGTETTLPQSGTGWWDTTGYDDNGEAYGSASYYIGGVQTSLPQSGTGAWNNKYWIGGAETTLNESGTGTWNNAYYMAAVATQLDANGNGFLNGLFYVGGVLASGPVQFSNVPPSPPAWGNFTYYQQGAVVSDNGSLWLLVSTGGWTVGGRPGLGYGWQKLSTGEGGLPTPSVNLAQLLGLPPFVQL